jgi:hypothetical protein
LSAIVGELARVRGAFEQPTLTLLHQKSAAVIIAIFRTSFGRDLRKAEPTRGVLDAVAHRDVRAPGERPSIPFSAGGHLGSVARWSRAHNAGHVAAVHCGVAQADRSAQLLNAR